MQCLHFMAAHVTCVFFLHLNKILVKNIGLIVVNFRKFYIFIYKYKIIKVVVLATLCKLQF